MTVGSRKWIRASVALIVFTGFLFSIPICHALSDQSKSRTTPSIVRMGVVKRVNSAFVLKSGRTTYRIAGQDFSPWIGKKVKVSGTMIRKEKRMVLEVTKIEEVKKDK
jgi:hypothetical protein